MGNWFGMPRDAVVQCGDKSHLATYNRLSTQLRMHGFDSAAMSASSRLFTRDTIPRRYEEPPWSLPPQAVRVVALPLMDAELSYPHTQRLAFQALQAALEIKNLLPRNSRVWVPNASGLHVTLFHPGLSPQADTNGRWCNLPLPVPPAKCWQRNSLGGGSPSDSELRQELQTIRHLASRMPHTFTLEVDRLAMAPSGVMLMLLRASNQCARRPAHPCPQLRSDANALLACSIVISPEAAHTRHRMCGIISPSGSCSVYQGGKEADQRIGEAVTGRSVICAGSDL